MEYCPHCMRPASGSKCPYCGGDMNWTGQVGIDLLVGSILTSSNGLRTYQLGAAMGKGGFGITYAALEVNSHRRMAIKEYFPSYCAFRAGNGRDVQVMTGQEQPYQKGLNSFLEEAKMLLSQEDLATLVKVVDFFQANGTAYLVMEFLDGVPLHRKMAELGGRFPAQVLLPTLPPLLSDLGTLHARGVIHRDISPDNIMWMPDGTLKLMDFGSARSTNTGKSMTMQMKQGFSPIEQYTRKGQGAWTDVYAMAATIYYCLTGVTPPSSAERLEEDPIRMPNELGAGLTQQQEQALLHAMAVQPGDRTRSMEEFAQELFREEPPKQEAYIPTPPAPEPVQPPISQQPQWAPVSQQPQQPPVSQQTYQPPVSQQPQQPPVSQQPQQPPVSQQTYQPPVSQQPQQPPVSQQPQWTQIPSSQQQSYTPPQQQTYQQYTQQQTPSQPVYQPPKSGFEALKEKVQTWCTLHDMTPKKIGIIGSIAAAVVLVVIIAVLAGRRDDSPSAGYDPNDHTVSTNAPTARPTLPNVPPTTTEATEATEDTTPEIIMVGDYQVQIIDENNATIVGFVGDEIGDLPSEADGVPITVIGKYAFKGANTRMDISLPTHLRTIEEGAFKDCDTLKMVYCFSRVTAEFASFDPTLRCVILYDDNAKIKLPDRLDDIVPILKRNASTGYDPDYNLDTYYIVDDIIYGIDSTRTAAAIVVDFPAGLSDIVVPNEIRDINGKTRSVYWIEKGALSKVKQNATIGLPDFCLIDYSLYESHPDSFYALESESMADSWLYLMRVVEAMNNWRGSDAPKIQPDTSLAWAAITFSTMGYAGGEQVTDELSWTDVLDVFCPDYHVRHCVYGKGSFSTLTNALCTEEYAGPLTGEESPGYGGQYYSYVALSYYVAEDGSPFWIVLFAIE